jgi:enoyl-CoA hydratase/carnithine racemase
MAKETRGTTGKVLYEKKGKTAIITINNPEHLNIYGPELGGGMELAVIEALDDDKIWTIILTGAGEKAFCAGNDLKSFLRTSDAHERGEGKPLGGARRFFEEDRGGGRVPIKGAGRGSILMGHGCQEKPIIAAINGLCFGGGLEMACGCDIRIASENATFQQSEPKRGMIAGVTPAKLTRLIPFNLALELLLTCRVYTAQEAYRIGLVNKVVPLKDLMSAALAMCDEINENAPLAMRDVKEAAWDGLLFYPTLSESIENNSRLLHEHAYLTEDCKEGMRAFVEKRKPVWKGR